MKGQPSAAVVYHRTFSFPTEHASNTVHSSTVFLITVSYCQNMCKSYCIRISSIIHTSECTLERGKKEKQGANRRGRQTSSHRARRGNINSAKRVVVALSPQHPVSQDERLTRDPIQSTSTFSHTPFFLVVAGA